MPTTGVVHHVPEAAVHTSHISRSTTQQLVVLSLGGEKYALPVGSVHEIIRYAEPRSVVSEAAWIRGVVGLRGKIIPIDDLAARFGLVAESDAGKIVVVETGAEQVGIMVDDVEGVLTVSGDQLEQVPPANMDSIGAIARIGDRRVMLLNPKGSSPAPASRTAPRPSAENA